MKYQESWIRLDSKNKNITIEQFIRTIGRNQLYKNDGVKAAHIVTLTKDINLKSNIYESKETILKSNTKFVWLVGGRGGQKDLEIQLADGNHNKVGETFVTYVEALPNGFLDNYNNNDNFKVENFKW